jgi:hypothetical protein
MVAFDSSSRDGTSERSGGTALNTLVMHRTIILTRRAKPWLANSRVRGLVVSSSMNFFIKISSLFGIAEYSFAKLLSASSEKYMGKTLTVDLQGRFVTRGKSSDQKLLVI